MTMSRTSRRVVADADLILRDALRDMDGQSRRRFLRRGVTLGGLAMLRVHLATDRPQRPGTTLDPDEDALVPPAVVATLDDEKGRPELADFLGQFSQRL